MIRAFFEGPAGSGKTHQLIDEAVAAAREVFIHSHQKLLALTFMNGARQRLEARFAGVSQLRGRFICLTFDSFAGSIVDRRRSLLGSLPAEGLPDALSDFDRVCINAARLLELPGVAAWVAASYPLVVVDESQDLDPYRFRILQALGAGSCVLAAADEFQNLNIRIDTAVVMRWLRAGDRHVQLAQNRRTSQDGLLRVAGALRDGRNVCGELHADDRFFRCYSGQGMRIVEAPAKSIGALAWAVANELSQLGHHAVLLTPDATSERVIRVLERVRSDPPFNRNKSAGTTFGPYQLAWEQREEEQVAALLEAVPGDGQVVVHEAVAAINAVRSTVGRYICARLERGRNVRGDKTVSRERLGSVIGDVLRDAGRHQLRAPAGRRIMTIHRAKNQEFHDVVVLWPHTVGGGAEQQRRLLYNGITRSLNRCAVVVFGEGRTEKAPFA